MSKFFVNYYTEMDVTSWIMGKKKAEKDIQIFLVKYEIELFDGLRASPQMATANDLSLLTGFSSLKDAEEYMRYCNITGSKAIIKSVVIPKGEPIFRMGNNILVKKETSFKLPLLDYD